jgi:cytochrome b561
MVARAFGFGDYEIQRIRPMVDTARSEYSKSQKILHWSVVILLAVQYIFFDNMGRLFHQTVEAGSPVWTTTSLFHASIGTSVLLLALCRLALRRKIGIPAPPSGGTEPDWAERAAYITHISMYVLLIGLPIGGLLAWYFSIELIAKMHEIGTTVLLWVVGLHVVAVAVHHFWWEDPIIKRMT